MEDLLLKLNLKEGSEYPETLKLSGKDLSNYDLILLVDLMIRKNWQIKYLDLSWNKLTFLPESLGKLKILTELNLSWNYLVALPESLGRLKALKVLNLNGNHLTSIPESLGQLINLTKLDLRNNRLTSLPESLGQLKALTRFDFVKDQLTTTPSVSEPSSKASGEVKQPEVEKEKSFQERLEEGLKMKEKYTSLIERLNLEELVGEDKLSLNLSMKDLIDEDIPFIDCFLSTHKQEIFSLDLSSNQLTKIPFFSSLPNLSIFCLNDNQIREIGDLSKMPKLSYLSLMGNRLTGKIDVSNLKLETLNIENNEVLPIGDRKNIRHLLFFHPVKEREEDPSVLFMKTSLKNISIFFDEERLERLRSDFNDNCHFIEEILEEIEMIREKLEKKSF
jgi:Leucine-rich repeat (LRR) protein